MSTFLTVGNLDVNILTVGNLDVDILTVGNLAVGKRTRRRITCVAVDVGAFVVVVPVLGSIL
jgi:hypothetical protein